MIKDIFLSVLGRTGPFGGVRFDEADILFDNQSALNLLPKVIMLPFETMLNICTYKLSEWIRDMIVGQLVTICSESCEQFITQVDVPYFDRTLQITCFVQTNFRFAGALKLEEIIRSLIVLFGRHSASPVRGKFSRLREVIQVLTTDLSGCLGNIDNATILVASESFTQLTTSNIESILLLRIDLTDDS